MAKEWDDAYKEHDFTRQIGEKEKRKIHAIKHGNTVWFGMGMSGLIGWSVAIPTVIGAFTGIWLDKNHPSASFSYTLALLVAGLVLGCFIAWHWIAKENNEIRNEQEDDNA